MDHILAIYDLEKKYVKKLAAFFENRTGMPFRILGFDNWDKLTRFLSGEQAAVLLIGEDQWQPKAGELAKQTILLTDQKEKECLESDLAEDEIPTVCKYQSGEAIARKVLSICALTKAPIIPLYPEGGRKDTRAQVVGVYTPVRRSLQTSFALVYSLLKGKSKRTLYLNFEVFAGFHAWFEREYRTDLMDLMYFLDGPEDKFLLKLACLTEQFGDFSYIPPAVSYEDFMLVKGQEWVKLVETIAKKSDYDIIVLDLGDQMQGLFDLLSVCDRVYTISKPDGIAMAKTAAFEEALRMSQRDEVLDKMVKCRLPVFKEIPQKAGELAYSQLADYMKNKLGEMF